MQKALEAIIFAHQQPLPAFAHPSPTAGHSPAGATIGAMFALLRTWSLQELRHHPWRSAAAACAVMLGVALAFAVHTINASALDEFAQAVRNVSGQPDVQLRAVQGHFSESVYERVATHAQVARASPVLELSVLAQALPADGAAHYGPASAAPPAPDTDAAPAQSTTTTTPASTPLRIIGADALLLPATAPAWMPQAFSSLPADRWALFAPATVFLNAAAMQALGVSSQPTQTPLLLLQTGLQRVQVRVAGSIAAPGAPLAVMDIGAAQDLFGRAGQLTRIDLQWQPGSVPEAVQQALQATPGWPANVLWAEPGDAAQSVGNLTRAYRVNLTVLALVALFTGAFLVFSVLALSVAQRASAFALLAVLGATPRQRLHLVLAESLVLGLVGSAAGIALGTALAALALRLLGGDLGGGYFTGAQPALQWSWVAALLYGGLGVGAALLGGWWPARAAQALPPAQTLKGLGQGSMGTPAAWPGMVLIAASALLAYVPPVFGIPLAAYVSIALLLVGGIALLPWGVAWGLRWYHPGTAPHLLALLALERARRTQHSAAVAVGGVVASLSLAVALTVMVTSFRGSVIDWLDAVLPAPLYARSATSTGTDAPVFSPALLQRIAQLPGVERVQGTRVVNLLLAPDRPAITLLARPLGPEPARTLALVAPALPVPPGHIPVYASEAMAALWGAAPGQTLPALSKAFMAQSQSQKSQAAPFFVAGVWRDYARQTGAVAMDMADYIRLTGDGYANDLAIWPRSSGTGAGSSRPDDTGTSDADLATLQQTIEALAQAESRRTGAATSTGTETTSAGADAPLLEFGTAQAIRTRSLQIFDRSFAVTYWLQAVAIGIGLFGVAASFSAQVLARRKEFGLLAHLGLTRRQILTVVAGEGAAWTGAGAVAGVLLGTAVAVVLVHVVNPQSFHWTMELRLPLLRLLALAVAVVLCGTLTAWLAGRAAAGRDAVLAVKEDW